MSLEHINIPDPQRHEPRGASTASMDQALVSDGNGTTSFRNITSAVTDSLRSDSFADQLLSATGIEHQITFGSATDSPNSTIALSDDGQITFVQPGTYHVAAYGSLDRSNSTGHAVVAFKLEYNGLPLGSSSVISLDHDNDAFEAPISNSIVVQAEAGDRITYHMVRVQNDSGDVGLKPYGVGITGWNDTASASIYVTRLGTMVER